MLRHDCTQLPDILAASAGGRGLSEPLAAHLAACPSCREQVEAAAFVRGLADTPDAPHALPDPVVVWWKAQLLRRWQAEQVASAPIERMRWVELAAGVVSLAVFLLWQGRGIAALLARVVPASVSAMAASPQAASPTALLMTAAVTISIAVTFLAALHRRLGERRV